MNRHAADGLAMTAPPSDEDTTLLAALRDDIAARTHPDEPVTFTSDLICALLDEIVRLRHELAIHAACDSTASEPERPLGRS